jgi:tetratricopeptide (TPR) repeat protein
MRGILLALTGQMEKAAVQIRHSGELAEQTGEPETRGYVHAFGVQQAVLSGDVEMAIEHGTQAARLADETGIPLQIADGYLAKADAQILAERWQDAIDSLGKTMEIIDTRKNLLSIQPRLYNSLALAYLGKGDENRALYYAEETLALAEARDAHIIELIARITLVRAMLVSHDRNDADAIQAGIGTVLKLVDSTGAIAYRPMVHLVLAEIARLAADPDRRAAQLGRAHRFYTEMGSRGHARSVAVLLAEHHQQEHSASG